MENKKVEIVIPFCGFYESAASEFVEREIFSNFCYVNKLNKDDINELTEKQYEKYSKYEDKNITDERNRYINRYTELFFDELHNLTDIQFNFTELKLESPRFYNFTTDRIFCKVDFTDLVKLYSITDYTKLTEKIKEKFTSYDGFLSYYTNDVNESEWQHINEFDHNQWLTVLNCWLDYDSEELDNIACGMSF